MRKNKKSLIDELDNMVIIVEQREMTEEEEKELKYLIKSRNLFIQKKGGVVSKKFHRKSSRDKQST